MDWSLKDGMIWQRFRGWPAEDKILVCALGFSVLLHAVLLVEMKFPGGRIFNQPVKGVEVQYRVLKAAAPAPEIKKPQEMNLIKDQKITSTKPLMKIGADRGPVFKDSKREMRGLHLAEQKPLPLDHSTVERKVTVPLIHSEKINNPGYLKYYNDLRNRIREKAYGNYAQFESGEVCLAFVLAADGTVRQLRIVEEKTTASEYLRNIGLKSIQDSNPFPPFPKELPYPELPFNTSITFEIHE